MGPPIVSSTVFWVVVAIVFVNANKTEGTQKKFYHCRDVPIGLSRENIQKMCNGIGELSDYERKVWRRLNLCVYTTAGIITYIGDEEKIPGRKRKFSYDIDAFKYIVPDAETLEETLNILRSHTWVWNYEIGAKKSAWQTNLRIRENNPEVFKKNCLHLYDLLW